VNDVIPQCWCVLARATAVTLCQGKLHTYARYQIRSDNSCPDNVIIFLERDSAAPNCPSLAPRAPYEIECGCGWQETRLRTLRVDFRISRPRSLESVDLRAESFRIFAEGSPGSRSERETRLSHSLRCTAKASHVTLIPNDVASLIDVSIVSIGRG